MVNLLEAVEGGRGVGIQLLSIEIRMGEEVRGGD